VVDHRPDHRPPGEAELREEASPEGDHEGEDARSSDLPVDSDVPEQTRASARLRAHHVLRDRWDILLVIAAGGSLGSLARWALTTTFPYEQGGFAWATAVENVTGAFVLGVLMVFILDVWPTTRYARPFLGVGVLGGYTTFSTYMLDTRVMLAEGHVPAALAYLFGTLVTGLLAVWLGVLSARTVVAAVERGHRRRHADGARAAEDPASPTEPPRDRTHDSRARSTR
jgi:CrcB protein